MRQVNPAWKLLTAVFSVLLTVLVWQQGLQESFNRPSFAPKLSLRQHEMAVVASNVLSTPIREVLVGVNPKGELRELLEEIPPQNLDDRQKIILASLQELPAKRIEFLKGPFNDKSLTTLQQALLDDSSSSGADYLIDENLKKDPLLYQLACFALGGDEDICIDYKGSNLIALKLIVVQLLPFLATGLGVLLLIRQLWLAIRKKSLEWPLLTGIPLSLVDMTLLICGGFVVLGEIIFPALILPLSSPLYNFFSDPINQSLKVFVGYSSMTIPTLFILYQQLKNLNDLDRPQNGWLQWRVKPINTVFFQATSGWLMIMPFVLITGWLTSLFWGDQGGSNPLLDLVLNSHSNLALLLLLITTVVLAPAFEELIFRGTLLPVLTTKYGRSWGILVSALVFALAHLSIGELPPLFVLGLGLGILRLSSGGLFPCVIMHSLWNGITFINLLLLAI
tara:strand:- start:11543 stop:12892 length:1350 start_codon:yes stop_codon:yes gene_type:complete